jgi:hypothetical protein
MCTVSRTSSSTPDTTWASQAKVGRGPAPPPGRLAEVLFQLGGHGFSPFLDAALRSTFGFPWPATMLDTARLAAALGRRRHLTRPSGPDPSLRLPDLAAAHGLPVHPDHDPLHDALTTAQLFLALATGWKATG